jgi:hypothetical protein
MKESLHGKSFSDIRTELSSALNEKLGAEPPVWIEEIFEDSVVYTIEGTDSFFQLDYVVVDNNVVLGDNPIKVQRSFVPVESAKSVEPVNLTGDIIPLVEKATRRDGTIAIKIIQPGRGSSGYYPEETLKRDGPNVFRAGTKMFWDHPTPAEEAERPEGSLHNLAAELVSDARYENRGVYGPGLYADIKPFGKYKESIEELAEHIGVSIRASGMGSYQTIDGQKVPVIEKLVDAKSVDFVTTPGAGGKILQLFESARAHGRAVQNIQEVSQVEKEEMELKLKQLQEVEKENLLLKEAIILRDARDIVAQTLSEQKLPELSKQRLLETLSINPPVVEGKLDKEGLIKAVKEAVEKEIAYLESVFSVHLPKVTGMGESKLSSSEYTETDRKSRELLFTRLGLSESAAKIAANGRGEN